MGTWGLIIGWPLFISLSIIIGNVLGILNGEWANANKCAKEIKLGDAVDYNSHGCYWFL